MDSIKVFKVLDNKFNDMKDKDDIEKMELILEIKKELINLIELPF